MILHGELPVRLLQLALGGIWLHLTWAMGRWVQIQKVQIKMVLYNTREEVAEPAMAMTNAMANLLGRSIPIDCKVLRILSMQ